jgi:hypothetical protein
MDIKIMFNIQTYAECKKSAAVISSQNNYPCIGVLQQAYVSFTTAQGTRQAK